MKKRFKSLKEESEFWDTHDTTDFLEEFQEVQEPIVDKRPPKRLISLRLDPETVLLAKRIAQHMGIGYQTLLRIWIMEGLHRELAKGREQGGEAGPAKAQVGVKE